MTDEVCRKYRDDLLSHTEGALSGPALTALTGHLETCAACRDEYDCLVALQGDLEAIGDEFAHNTPHVDLLAGVLEGVHRTKQARRVVVSFEPPARRRNWGSMGWMGAAAAAAIMMGLWVAGYRLTRESGRSDLPMQAHVQEKETTRPAAKPGAKSVPPSKAKFDEIKRLMASEPKLTPQGELAAAKTTSAPDFASISVTDILALRRSAALGADPESRQDARARLAAWASLSEDRARALADSPDASTDAKVGAAQALPASQAERVLLAAVQSSPDNPYLRGELAKAYAAQPDKQAEAAAQLAEQGRLDPENALNQYKIASSLLRQGDAEGAAAALEQAKTLESVNTYATESDASREQALVASGMPADAARALTALTAGMNQYTELVDLATSLLQQGQQAEQQGNLSYAKDIYESVRMMGTQIADSSLLSNERLAGLDIQSSAIDSMFRLLGLDGTLADIQELTSQIDQLSQAYDQIVQFIDGINTFFSGNITQNVLSLVADFITQHGDLNLIDYISSFAPKRAAGSATVPSAQ